jgi:cellobiose phosphorylase
MSNLFVPNYTMPHLVPVDTLCVEAILGLRREGNNLRIEPSIHKDWKDYEISYRFGRAMHHIRVESPRGANHGVSQIVMDGRVLTNANTPPSGRRTKP